MNKFFITIFVILQTLLLAKATHMVCFLDSTNPVILTTDDLDDALQHCTHFIYGYAMLTPRYNTLSFDGSVQRSIKLTDISKLKKKYPHAKYLLSLGGDRDVCDGTKYLQLLEAPTISQHEFLRSAIRILRQYEFDGLDLAYQLPRNQLPRLQTEFLKFWGKIFRRDLNPVPKTEEHKRLFTNFIKNIRQAFQTENLMLSLSVLPNVNSSWYFDIPSIIHNLDFVNLWSFDFNTPARNPKEADYTAPLMQPAANRLPFNNANFQVQYWLSQKCDASKLVLGIPSYGRTWQISMNSRRSNDPIVKHTYGASEAGEESQTQGLLGWGEICARLKDPSITVKGSYDYGQYIVYPHAANSSFNTWIVYDGPNIAYYKSLYAKEQHLGGLALIDLSLDDFDGSCNELKFPILKYMNGIFA